MTSSTRIEVTKDQIINDLNRIGVEKGDHVAVTLSFKSIGYVTGGPEAFIDALLETVGSEGTIMMNTYTKSFGVAVIPSDYVYDKATTVPYTGLVPRIIIKRKDVVRSRHPTCSVASIGKMANYLTECHDEKANPFLPYEKLAEIGGKYLAIGIGDRLVGLRHEAQRRAGLFAVPLYAGVKFKSLDGKIKVFIGISAPCTKKLPELVPRLEKMGEIFLGVSVCFCILTMTFSKDWLGIKQVRDGAVNARLYIIRSTDMGAGKCVQDPSEVLSGALKVPGTGE